MADTINLSDVQHEFEAFATANGASVDFALANDDMLMARCVLPSTFEVKPGDTLKGGVAVRGTLQEIEVRPYLLRQVCTNGAIMMKSSSGSIIATAECTLDWLNGALATAGSKESLAGAAGEVRSIAAGSFDRAFLFATLFDRIKGFDRELGKEVLRRLMTEGLTGFALMNALTSVARDTKDPQTRWRLESAGGSVPACLLAGPDPRLGLDALEMPAFGRELQLA